MEKPKETSLNSAKTKCLGKFILFQSMEVMCFIQCLTVCRQDIVLGVPCAKLIIKCHFLFLLPSVFFNDVKWMYFMYMYVCMYIYIYIYIYNMDIISIFFYTLYTMPIWKLIVIPLTGINKVALHCIALHCIALHCIALHCIALHCIALHCIALHCIALHCIALHCIAKLDNSWHMPYDCSCCQSTKCHTRELSTRLSPL